MGRQGRAAELGHGFYDVRRGLVELLAARWRALYFLRRGPGLRLLGRLLVYVCQAGRALLGELLGRKVERLGLLVASGLGVAIFFGGWQLPGGIEARSTVLQVLAAVLFVVKTWALCAALLGLAAIASPWTARESRRFLVRRLLPALAIGGLFVALSRRLPPSEALEAALGATLVTALALLVLRAGLRIRGAMQRPEPHASPFL